MRSSTRSDPATVTSANFRILLQAADHPWRLFTEEEVEKLKTFVSGLKPQVDQCRRLTLDSSALWSKVRVFDGAEGDEGKTDDRGIYKAQFEEAWASIVASVEREVLEVIGLPNVHVYAKDPGTFGSNRPGYYDEETQTIYLTGGNLTMSSIRHEFGHHIEDQGPVEIWFGLALILNWLSGKRPLEPPPRGAIRQIYSIQRTAEDPDVGVPNLIYSATYYEDGGTELLSTSLENDVLGNLKPYINWPPGMRDRTPTRLGDCKCGPEFAYLLLHALRPEEMRAAGFPSPALLCV